MIALTPLIRRLRQFTQIKNLLAMLVTFTGKLPTTTLPSAVLILINLRNLHNLRTIVFLS